MTKGFDIGKDVQRFMDGHEDRLARLREMDNQQKVRVLSLLEQTLNEANVYVVLRFEPGTERVYIKFPFNEKPEIVVNVNMDNAAAMLYDIFKQAGPELVAEA